MPTDPVSLVLFSDSSTYERARAHAHIPVLYGYTHKRTLMFGVGLTNVFTLIRHKPP